MMIPTAFSWHKYRLHEPICISNHNIFQMKFHIPTCGTTQHKNPLVCARHHATNKHKHKRLMAFALEFFSHKSIQSTWKSTLKYHNIFSRVHFILQSKCELLAWVYQSSVLFCTDQWIFCITNAHEIVLWTAHYSVHTDFMGLWNEYCKDQE